MREKWRARLSKSPNPGLCTWLSGRDMIHFIHTRQLGGRFCSESYRTHDDIETWTAIQPMGGQHQAWGVTVVILHTQGPHWTGGHRPEHSGQCSQRNQSSHRQGLAPWRASRQTGGWIVRSSPHSFLGRDLPGRGVGPSTSQRNLWERRA